MPQIPMECAREGLSELVLVTRWSANEFRNSLGHKRICSLPTRPAFYQFDRFLGRCRFRHVVALTVLASQFA